MVMYLIVFKQLAFNFDENNPDRKRDSEQVKTFFRGIMFNFGARIVRLCLATAFIKKENQGLSLIVQFANRLKDS